MKKLKEEKGITLVALVITIVVLLILAMVAIGAVQDSKIIGHSQNAAGSYNQAKANEIDTITGYEETINKYVPGENIGTIPPTTLTGTQYYVLDDSADLNIYEIKFAENTVNISIYAINSSGELLGSQNIGTFQIEEVNEGETTINVGSNPVSTQIAAPYKLINLGMNTYLKDDKYYIPENANYYVVATLDPDFDTSILKNENDEILKEINDSFKGKNLIGIFDGEGTFSVGEIGLTVANMEAIKIKDNLTESDFVANAEVELGGVLTTYNNEAYTIVYGANKEYDYTNFTFNSSYQSFYGINPVILRVEKGHKNIGNQYIR